MTRFHELAGPRTIVTNFLSQLGGDQKYFTNLYVHALQLVHGLTTTTGEGEGGL